MSQDPFTDLKHASRRRTWIVFVVLGLVLAVGGALWLRRSRRPQGTRWLTARVTRGPVQETVETSGVVQPVVQVQVGSQVSGRITRVSVDFNSRVRHGDVLAEIDPTSFRAAVAQSRAALLSAQSQLQRARVNARVNLLNLHRAQELRQRGLNAQADVDLAQGQYDVSVADVAVANAEIARARALLSSAETNLTFTRIVAPIDGIVIQRSIDEGQTVAASFQAPVLFQLANDLTRMRIIANVDEADIAKLRERMTAVARVDAFPGETFRGEVSELRFGSTTTAGVVTYPAVITLGNPDLKLRPGMTATITVTSARHEDVLRVPNAALRFIPSTDADAGRAEPEAAENGVRMGALYILRSNRPTRVRVRLGLSDETVTEVSAAELSAGAEVVTDEADPTDAPAGSGGSSPPGMGGGSRRGGGGRM